MLCLLFSEFYVRALCVCVQVSLSLGAICGTVIAASIGHLHLFKTKEHCLQRGN